MPSVTSNFTSLNDDVCTYTDLNVTVFGDTTNQHVRESSIIMLLMFIETFRIEIFVILANLMYYHLLQCVKECDSSRTRIVILCIIVKGTCCKIMN